MPQKRRPSDHHPSSAGCYSKISGRLTKLRYQLDRSLRRAGGAGGVRFVDVAHGAVVIEYEPPNCFNGGRALAVLQHARAQAEEYAELLSEEEGRPLDGYQVVAWDGAFISFGRSNGAGFQWEPVTPFDAAAASRLLVYLRNDGAPLVHPGLLSQLVGPESSLGAQLLPKLFHAVESAAGDRTRTNKTLLMFTEWRRLFGQVVGVQSERLQNLLASQGAAHGANYHDNIPAYLFALNTYIALVAKLVAAMAVPNASRSISDPATPIAQRIETLENGQLFADAGVLNMLNGDFFAWYRDDSHWDVYAPDIEALLETLHVINFDVSRKSPESTRDLFKGLYMRFVPRALRHALGEYYTPDWLAGHALDILDWQPEKGLGDPTCGSGTFILEALRRRMIAAPDAPAEELLDGLWGLDLNPLAVLAARASLVVYLADRLKPEHPLRLPVFLADAINPASTEDSVYRHTIQTEKGNKEFRIPATLVEHVDFFALMGRARELIDANYSASTISNTIAQDFTLDFLDIDERDHLRATIDTLVELHSEEWNGIWCAILADRFAAGAIPQAEFIAGNPPWVKWSHLPPDYAEFIKERCLELGVFSVDRWVGGIESDISTVITYEAIDKYLRPGGTLAFFITGTVFANESSQGFRRWHLRLS